MPSLPRPPSALTGDTVVLRAFRDADWRLEQRLSEIVEVVRWTSHPDAMIAAEARARVRRQQERARRGATQRYVIWDADTPWGSAAGAPGPALPGATYALLPGARGRGIAAGALLTLTRWAAEHGAPE